MAYPPPKTWVLGGGYRVLDFSQFLSKCSKKNFVILSKNLVQKKIFMVIEYSMASEYTIEKKFFSFWSISQKALHDACKVLSEGSYPHTKNLEFFFTTQSQRVLFGLQ